ncbi:MAG: hypothetical protein ND807_07620 [Vicinamibacterales bacterium]|nr:hypothetical protein [Vicinamibacterales bacterium]
MRHIFAFFAAALLLTIPSPSEAQQPAPPRPQAPATPIQIDLSTRNANETRERLREVLNQYPPSVREVLRIDTSLLTRSDYLATYPVLAAFLEQHPEVAHNPAFFVGESQRREEYDNNPRIQGFRTLSQLGESFMTLFIIMTITSGIVFLLKTLAEQLRWQRAWSAQSALNNKLVDRFSSSEELLGYLQSPAGKGLTDLPALPQASAVRSMSAPLGRIFWSMQAGIVLSALGIGTILVSARFEEIGEAIFAPGAVVLAIGIGFVASAAVSFLLSKRLGLVTPPKAGYSADTLSS